LQFLFGGALNLFLFSLAGDVSWLVDMDEIEEDLQLGTMQCTVWLSIASWNC
jgi:hypothetical protein